MAQAHGTNPKPIKHAPKHSKTSNLRKDQQKYTRKSNRQHPKVVRNKHPNIQTPPKPCLDYPLMDYSSISLYLYLSFHKDHTRGVLIYSGLVPQKSSQGLRVAERFIVAVAHQRGPLKHPSQQLGQGEMSKLFGLQGWNIFFGHSNMVWCLIGFSWSDNKASIKAGHLHDLMICLMGWLISLEIVFYLIHNMETSRGNERFPSLCPLARWPVSGKNPGRSPHMQRCHEATRGQASALFGPFCVFDGCFFSLVLVFYVLG